MGKIKYLGNQLGQSFVFIILLFSSLVFGSEEEVYFNDERNKAFIYANSIHRAIREIESSCINSSAIRDIRSARLVWKSKNDKLMESAYKYSLDLFEYRRNRLGNKGGVNPDLRMIIEMASEVSEITSEVLKEHGRSDAECALAVNYISSDATDYSKNSDYYPILLEFQKKYN